MYNRHMDKTYKDINWAAPTEEDIAFLRTLSRTQHKALLDEHLKSAKGSGVTERTIDDLWNEALKRAQSAA